MKKKILSAVLVVGFTGVGVIHGAPELTRSSYSAVAQCACAQQYIDITPHNEFKLADAVIIGEVLEITKTDEDKKTSRYTELLKVEVKQAWKMDMKSTITLRNTIIGCVNGFKVKESWLLYLYKNKDGSLATYCCCTRTRRLSDADEDLKEFKKKGETPARVLTDPV